MSEFSNLIEGQTRKQIIKPLVIVLPIAIGAQVFINIDLESTTIKDSLNWLFSASAQSIAAFIGFIIAGYMFRAERLIQQESTVNDDEAYYIPIVRQYFYNDLKVLCLWTGLSVLCNLTMLLINSTLISIKVMLYIFTIGISIYTLIKAIHFVIQLVNPVKWDFIAKKTLDQKYGDREKVNELGEFTRTFALLENALRQLVEKLDISPDRTNFMAFSRMIMLLRYNKILDESLYDRLKEIGSYRNLVFHGKETLVSKDMLNLLIDLNKQIGSLL